MNRLDLSSAIVPVTGGASGIGLAICKRLRAAGATVLLLGRDEARLAAGERQVYGDGACDAAHRYVVDVSDSQAVDECFERIGRDHGGATHVVANAGIIERAHVLDLTDAQWHEVIGTNQHGMMYVCRAAARQLVRRQRGAIVTIGSLAGLKAREGRLAYAASKAAVINMTRALALDLGEHGVRVNAVIPGFVDTPIQQRKPAAELQALAEKVPLKRICDPAEIADAVLFLLSDMASYITGETLVVDGGINAKYVY